MKNRKFFSLQITAWLFSIICIILFFLFTVTTHAAPSNRNDLDALVHCQEEINNPPEVTNAMPGTLLRRSSRAKVDTRSKTLTYKNGNGKIILTIKITGKFTWNGKTSKCLSSNVTTNTYSKNWKIENQYAKKYGSTAEAHVTAKLYQGSKVVQTVSKNVTLTCSKNGSFH